MTGQEVIKLAVDYMLKSRNLIDEFLKIEPCHNGLYCTFCGASVESQWSSSTEHNLECIYLKFSKLKKEYS